MKTTTKGLRNYYRFELTSQERENIYKGLVHDRRCLAGKYPNYDPNIGSRKRNLRRYCGHSVIRLVLNAAPSAWFAR